MLEQWILDLQPHISIQGAANTWESTVWEYTVWESTILGLRIWIWGCTYLFSIHIHLGVYIVGVYKSRATDFGSRGAHSHSLETL